MIKAGTVITGKDRSYVRSIYQLGEPFPHDREGETVMFQFMHLLSYNGYVVDGTKEQKYRNACEWIEANYREATAEEIEASARGDGSPQDTLVNALISATADDAVTKDTKKTWEPPRPKRRSLLSWLKDALQ